MDKLGSNSPIRPQIGISKAKVPSAPIKKSDLEKTGTPPSDLVQINDSPAPAKKETVKPAVQEAPKPQTDKPAAPNAPTTIAVTEDPFVVPSALPGKEAPRTFEQQMAELMKGLSQKPESGTVEEAIGKRFQDCPPMKELLVKFVGDDKHPTNLAANLQNPSTRSEVMDELAKMVAEPHPCPETFKRSVEDSKASGHPLMDASGDDRFNVKNGKKGMGALREELLQQDPVLYSSGANPTPEQQKKLKAHAKRLARVMPKLSKDLEEMVSDIAPGSGFPTVSARTKNADGMIDKIRRMTQGNDGKDPRPDYQLADMPDALGARIVVKDPKSLEKVMGRLEEKFGEGKIFEKDNFYSNPKKQSRSPYRVITYTVIKDGVPAEIQLTTLRSSIAADLYHNTHYKPYHPDLSQEASDYVIGLHRSVAKAEHDSLKAGGGS